MIEGRCKGSGQKWKTGVGRTCPVCLQSYTDIAQQTGRTGTSGIVPGHKS